MIKPFLNAGIFPLQKVNQSETVKAKDKWFYGAQAGVEWSPDGNRHQGQGGSMPIMTFEISPVSAIPNFGDTLFNQTAHPVPAKRQQPFQHR